MRNIKERCKTAAVVVGIWLTWWLFWCAVEKATQWSDSLAKVMKAQTAKDNVIWVSWISDELSRSILFVQPGQEYTANYETINIESEKYERYYESSYETTDNLLSKIQEDYQAFWYNTYQFFVEDFIKNIETSSEDKTILVGWYYIRISTIYAEPAPWDDSIPHWMRFNIAVSKVKQPDENETARYLEWYNFILKDIKDLLAVLDSESKVTYWTYAYNLMKRTIDAETNVMLWNMSLLENDSVNQNIQDYIEVDSIFHRNLKVINHLSESESMWDLRSMYIFAKYFLWNSESIVSLAWGPSITANKQVWEQLLKLSEKYPNYTQFNEGLISSFETEFSEIERNRLESLFINFVTNSINSKPLEDRKEFFVDNGYGTPVFDYNYFRPLFLKEIKEISEWNKDNCLFGILLDISLADIHDKTKRMIYNWLYENTVANAIKTTFNPYFHLDYENWYLYVDDVIQKTEVIFRAYKTINWRDVLLKDWEEIIPIEPTERFSFESTPLVTHVDNNKKIDINYIKLWVASFPKGTKIKMYWIWKDWETLYKSE